MTMSKPIENPLVMACNECVSEVVEISGTKRPISECPSRSNAGSAHIVYVRRKPESDLAKSKICDTQIDSLLLKSTDQGEACQQLTHVEPLRASSPSFSSTKSSVSLSPGTSSSISSAKNVKHVEVNCSNPSPKDPKTADVWEEGHCRLQSFLKMLDQSDQHEYVQLLRSLSSVELSRHAVELEKRAMKLSMEEAKEIERVCLFDVLGKCGNNVCKPSTQQEQLQK